jgi:hypothetical protein
LKGLIALFPGIIRRFKGFVDGYNKFVDEAHERDMLLQASKVERFARYLRCNWFWDLHDYTDDLENGAPCHFIEFTCSYCGKKFFI